MTSAVGRTEIEGFAGQLVGPEDEAYDAARAVWNAMHDRRPKLIARWTYIKAGFALELTDELIATLAQRGAEVSSALSQIEVLALGGAIGRVRRDPTPGYARSSAHTTPRTSSGSIRTFGHNVDGISNCMQYFET